MHKAYINSIHLYRPHVTSLFTKSPNHAAFFVGQTSLTCGIEIHTDCVWGKALEMFPTLS